MRGVPLAWVLLAAIACGHPQPARPGAPVVVLITAANLRADVVDLEDLTGLTPRLAAVAQRASFAGPAVAGSSSELAALASLLSGVPPSEHGVWAWELDRVGTAAPWLADRLAASGVTTQAWVGRPISGEDRGWSRGFSRWQQLGRLRAVRTALAEPPSGPSFTWVDLPGARPPWHLAEVAIPGDVDRASLPLKLDPLELGRRAEGDWFATPREEATARALYRHAVARADADIGDLLDAAFSGPRADDTLVIVASDCGYRLGEDGRVGIGHGQDRVDLSVPLLIIGRKLQGFAPGAEPSMLALAPALGTVFGLPPIPAWRHPASPALAETPVSNGWRASAAIATGFQLRRQQRWGPPAPDLLHPDSVSAPQLSELLSFSAADPYHEVWRLWQPTSTKVIDTSDVPLELRVELAAALDRLTAPRPGRLVDQRRLMGHHSRAILPTAPDNGASGP